MKWFLIKYIEIGSGGYLRYGWQKASCAMAASGRWQSSNQCTIVISADIAAYNLGDHAPMIVA
jgi:hypothetical protein